MREKREADQKYQQQKSEYERLQATVSGDTEQARALETKQAKLESEREQLVSNYEGEIVKLRNQNQEYQRHLEENTS